MEPRIQYAKTSDGVSIAYWTLGRGQPFVCLPPYGWSHLQLEWQYPETRVWYERLAGTRKLVRYDVRGQGLSARDVDDLSFEAFLLDLQAVADQLELENFALHGGGPNTPLAIAYAARHPERITHLILWQPQFKVMEAGRPGAALLEVARNDWETYTEATAQGALGWSQGDRARLFASFIRQSVNRDTWLEISKHFDETDVTPLLPSVDVPTLVLARPQEPVLHASHFSSFASQMQNARVVFLKGTEPGLQLGDIEEGLGAIDEFLGEGDAATEPPEPGAFRTVLFTDLVGHTQMMSRLGDELGRAVAREHERITREVLKQHGGSEVKTMGDGFMASFGSVTKSLECAIALQRAFAERDGELLSIRIGLNAGEPIEEDGDLFGAMVILASRIAAKAAGGEILVSDNIRSLCAGKGFLFSDRGEFVAKGFEEPVRVYEARWREGA